MGAPEGGGGAGHTHHAHEPQRSAGHLGMRAARNSPPAAHADAGGAQPERTPMPGPPCGPRSSSLSPSPLRAPKDERTTHASMPLWSPPLMCTSYPHTRSSESLYRKSPPRGRTMTIRVLGKASLHAAHVPHAHTAHAVTAARKDAAARQRRATPHPHPHPCPHPPTLPCSAVCAPTCLQLLIIP